MTPIYLEDNRPAARRVRRTLLVAGIAAAVGLIAAVWTSAHAQTRVTVRDSVTYRFIARPIHDTVIKTVTKTVHDTLVVTKCYDAQRVAILCPTTPAPTPTPTPTPAPAPAPTPAPPPPSTGAPSPAPDATILWRENFDAMTSTNVSWISQGGASLAPGMNGGKALQFSYTPGNSDNLIERTFASTTNFYASYNFKISAGWLPHPGGTGSGMKWFMPWRDGSGVTPRYTCGVGQLTNPWWQFTCHDNGSSDQPNPFGQNVTGTPNFATTNDGNWHQYVLHVVTGDAGYEQIWIDGVLVLDNSNKTKYPYHHLAQGISLVQFPGLVVDGISDAAHSGTIAIDNVVFWKP